MAITNAIETTVQKVERLRREVEAGPRTFRAPGISIGRTTEQAREELKAAESLLSAEQDAEWTEAARRAKQERKAAQAALQTVPDIVLAGADAGRPAVAAEAALGAADVARAVADVFRARHDVHNAARRLHAALQSAASEPDAVAALLDRLGDDAASVRRALPEESPYKLPPRTTDVENGAVVRLMLLLVEEAQRRSGIIVE